MKEFTTTNPRDYGYVKLASAILECEVKTYDTALSGFKSKHLTETKRYDIYNDVKSIENAMLSSYYAVLGMGVVDFLAFINQKRKEYNLPPRRTKYDV